jgi:hypothetical protein
MKAVYTIVVIIAAHLFALSVYAWKLPWADQLPFIQHWQASSAIQSYIAQQLAGLTLHNWRDVDYSQTQTGGLVVRGKVRGMGNGTPETTYPYTVTIEPDLETREARIVSHNIDYISDPMVRLQIPNRRSE